MKQFKTVFLFELSNYFSTKAYILTTILYVVLVAVGLSFPRISALLNQPSAPEQQKLYIVAEQSLADSLAPYVGGAEINNLQLTHEDAVKAVQSGEYSEIYFIQSENSVEQIVATRNMYDSSTSVIQAALQSKIQMDKLAELQLKPEEIQGILAPEVASTVTVLNNDQTQNYFYTFAVIFLMYMMVLLYGQMVASSVAKEKSSRAMEMLITSARTKNFIYGKVCASALASFLQMAVLLVSSFLFYNLNKEFYIGNPIVQSLFAIPLSVLLYALLFFVVGFLNFAFLFGALGSTVSKVEDLNQAVTPITLFFVLVYLLVSMSMSTGNLDNTLMVIASFFPLSSPMAMFARITLGNVDALSIAISIALLIGSIAVIANFATKIYDMGVLMYGNKIKFSQYFKVLKNK